MKKKIKKLINKYIKQILKLFVYILMNDVLIKQNNSMLIQGCILH